MEARKGPLCHILFSLALMLASACGPRPAAAYVMPAEQILALMGANFKNMRALKIQQSVEMCPSASSRACWLVDETLWLKAPSFFRAHIQRVRQTPQDSSSGGVSAWQPAGGAASVQQSHPSWDRRFYVLLLPNAVTAHLEFLKHLGVDLERVAFTRFNRRIAYRIGRGGEQDPKLVVEKERFLPLSLELPAAAPGPGDMVRVEFTDYRETPYGWFPRVILYHLGQRRCATYRISDLLVRVAVPTPLDNLLTTPPAPATMQTQSTQDTPPPPPGGAAEDRLQRIIQELQEKYQ